MSPDSGKLVDADAPAELRQERIAGPVQDHGFVRVVDLSGRFQVSTVTIRSDLQALEARGRLHRIRGGAVPANVVPGEQLFEASDGSKLGEVELAKVCDIDEVSLVISDNTADPAVVSEIEAVGCAVELAP